VRSFDVGASTNDCMYHAQRYVTGVYSTYGYSNLIKAARETAVKYSA